MSEMTALVVANVTIVQDARGRYNLNLLHQASAHAADTAKAPNRWGRLKSTKTLINELQTQVPHLALEMVHGGDHAGTYAHELLAVSYAGWISPAFQLKVNQAFIDSRKPSALKLHDPKLRMMVEAIVRMDAVEQQLALQQQQLVAQQQEMLKTQDLALAALRGQMWITIRQYVYLHDLARQLPPAQQRAYATWLGGYCLEKGIPMYKALTADTSWPDERTYHIGAMHSTLDTWLARRHGQAPLAILPAMHAKEYPMSDALHRHGGPR